jgi:hypothetical protein
MPSPPGPTSPCRPDSECGPAVHLAAARVDLQLLAAIRTRALIEDSSDSAVMRRWLRRGAAAEGIDPYSTT